MGKREGDSLFLILGDFGEATGIILLLPSCFPCSAGQNTQLHEAECRDERVWKFCNRILKFPAA